MTDTAEPVPAPTPPPPIPTPEESFVEIHKLKPIHSWRDFLKELGTIVLGIIIAISLEYLVESWHWDNEVKAARQAIRAEIAANNENILAFRVALAPCVDRQIAETDRNLATMEAGLDPPGFTSFNLPAVTLVKDGDWQAERASQVLTHFPRAELALMSGYYVQLPDFRSWGTQEGAAWRQLSALQKPSKGMTPSDLIRLRDALRAAQDAEFLIVSNAERQLRVSRQLGISDPTPDAVRIKNWCTMNPDDYRRYRRSQDLR